MVKNISQPKTWIAHGKVKTVPKLSGNFGLNDSGFITLSVKKKSSLLGQKTYSVQDIRSHKMPAVIVSAAPGDTLYLEYTADRYSLLSLVNNWTAAVNRYDCSACVYTVYDPDTLLFGTGYRQWGAFSYNGKGDNATQPIIESSLENTGTAKRDNNGHYD
jgi:hypothetical protein